ncbi:MAG: hypothetical protein ACI4GZ_03125 [Ruminococcus sp.]
MSIYDTVSKLIKKYGDSVTLTEDKETVQTNALIQPLLYKNKTYLGGESIPSGYLDSRHYLMIAPADITLKNGSEVFITCNGTNYTLKHTEVIRLGQRDLYIWAVLALYTPDAKDDYDEY